MIEHYKNRSLENIENEIWIPVLGYEELYSVSSFGRVNYPTTKDGWASKERKCEH